MAYGNIDYRERNLSYSQITEWNSCAFRHNLSYNLGYRPKENAIPLLLGTFIHEALAALILQQDPRVAVEEVAQTSIDSIESPIVADLIQSTKEQGLEIADRTDDWMGISAGHWKTVNFSGHGPMVEHKFSMPIEGWKGYVGVVDWVAENRSTGKIWLIDWKTRGRMADPRSEEVNLQLMSYLYVLRYYGLEVDGAAIVQILSKLPVQPKVNKDGSMSRAAITSDWSTYEKALIEQGLEPDDYFDMRQKLSDKDFFEFVELYFSDVEITTAWDRIILPTAKQIRKAGPSIRSMSTFNCKYCAFKRPCLEDLRGYDALTTLNTEYNRRDS